MRILILGINYAPETVGIAVYTSGLAEALAERGHDVAVIAAQPYYPSWKIADEHRGLAWREEEVTTRLRVVRCPLYVPAQPTGAKRILHHASFALSAVFPMMRRAWSMKPDIIMSVAPSLISAPVALMAGKVTGGRTWVHVQDYEVEAAFSTGLLSPHGRAGRLGQRFERSLLRRFDRVSSISPGMCAKAIEMGVAPENVFEFRNWADTIGITPLDRGSAYRAEFGIETEHVALYSGSLANKQGIEIILEAAEILANRDDLTFLICGDGPGMGELRARAEGLRNLRIVPLQPKERLGELLGLASVHILPQIARVGGLLLPSKLANILASGRPVVVTADAGSDLATEVAGCGLTVPPGDAVAFASAIEILLDDARQRAALGSAARNRCEARWSRSNVLNALEKVGLGMSKERAAA
jgi:colanic acid biosynthesis glycosyl transferase WcaI